MRLAVSIVAALTVASGAAQAQDLTLRDVLNEALRQSPRLLPAADAAERAGIQRRALLAKYSPRVAPDLNTGSAPAALAERHMGVAVSQLLPTGAELRGSASSLSFGTGPTAFHDAGYGFGLSQPLLRGFGATNRAELATAADAASTAARGEVEARQQLVVDAARAYFEVLREQRLVEESDRASARAATLLEMSQARAKVGLSTQLDVLRADLLKTQARTAALRARDALDAAREELNLLLGRPAGTPFTVAGDLAADTEALGAGSTAETAALDADALLQRALADRVDARTARDRVVGARRAVDTSRWSQLPQVDLNVDYLRRGLGPGVAPGYAALTNGWRLGLSTTYALDRGGAAAGAALAQIDLREAERAAADVQQHIAVDVHRAARLATSAVEAVSLAQASVDLAAKQRELAIYRFERGLADNLDVIDAENNMFLAESGLVAADIDRALALVGVQRAAGALDPGRFLQ
jgi:outer membrane protein TolC